ncbi:MAG: hypothetical protein KC561_20330, partial [Myxococcales bacterium]|nr:hypothetical protein [Myxococcales bacterium]
PSGLLAHGIPRVVLEGGTIDLSGVSFDQVPERFDNLAVRIEPLDGDPFAMSFNISSQVTGAPSGPLENAPDSFEISGRVLPQDDIAEVDLVFGAPLLLAPIPGLSEASLSFESIGFEYPYTFRVGELEVLDSRNNDPVVRIPRAAISLRELTTNIEDIYFSRIELDDVEIFAEVDRAGYSNIARLLGIPDLGPLEAILPDRADRRALREAAEQAARARAEAAANNPDPSPTNSEPGERAPRLCEGRKWFECFPQTLLIDGLRMEVLVHDEGVALRTVDIEIPTLTASQRVINFQMDLEFELTMTERGEGQVGVIGLEFIYYWLTDAWSSELTIQALDLAHFFRITTYPNVLGLTSGVIDGVLRVQERRPVDGNLEFEADPLRLSN